MKKKFLSLVMTMTFICALLVPFTVSAKTDDIDWNSYRIRAEAEHYDRTAGAYYDTTPDAQVWSNVVGNGENGIAKTNLTLNTAYGTVEFGNINLNGSDNDCNVRALELVKDEFFSWSITVPSGKGGTYFVVPVAATPTDTAVEITINNNAAVTHTVPGNKRNSYIHSMFQADYTQTQVTLAEGSNTVKVKNVSTTPILLKCVDFTQYYVLDGSKRPAGGEIRPCRQFGGGSAGLTGTDTVVGWNVNIREAGLYSVKAIGVADATAETKVSFLLDGTVVSSAVPKKSTASYNTALELMLYETELPSVSIDLPGEHAISFRLDSGSYGLDALVLERVGDIPPWETKYIEAEAFDTGDEGVAYHDTTNTYSPNEIIMAAQTALPASYTNDTSRSPVELRKIDVSGGNRAGMTQIWAEMEPGEWLRYTVNAPVAGTFNFYATVNSSANISFDVIVNDSQTVNVSCAASTAEQTWGFQTFVTASGDLLELTEGINYIKVKLPEGAAQPMLFDKFILSKNIIVEGEQGSMTGQGSGGANSVGYAPHMSGAQFYNIEPGTGTEWKVNVPAGAGGKYEVTAQGFTNTSGVGCVWNVSASANEGILASGEIPVIPDVTVPGYTQKLPAAPGLYTTWETARLGTLVLSEGENTLSLTSYSNSKLGYLDCLILRYIGGADEFTVGDFYIADAKGAHATEMTGTLYATAELTQNCSVETLMLSIAEYDADGKLLQIKMTKESLQDKEIGSVTMKIPVTLTASNSGGTVRAFLFDSGLKPLHKPAELAPPSTILYVSPGGNDGGSGTSAAPFKTLARAKQAVAALSADMDGDIVVKLAPGEYSISQKEAFTEEHGGHNGYRVIYKGTDPENPPVINGGTKITGWTQAEGNVWKAPANITDTRTLYIDGVPAQRAVLCPVASRGENMGELFGTNGKGGDYYTPSGSSEPTGILVPSSVTASAAAVAKGDVDALVHLEFASSRFRVTQIVENAASGKNALILAKEDFDAERASVGGGVLTTDYSRIYVTLENAKEFVNEPGEFYFDKQAKEIYYYPRTGENLGSAEVYAGTCEQMFTVKGTSTDSKVENIVFDNLDFRYGAWNGASSKGSVRFNQADQLKSMDRERADFMPAQLEIEYAKGVSVQNCSFSCLGSNAVSMYNAVTDSSISGNIFRDSSAGAVSIGSWEHLNAMPQGEERCQRITVKNNVIRRMAQEYKTCCAVIGYYVNNVKILHNDIEDLPYTAISLGWGWGHANVLEASGNVIADNRIVDISKFLTDGAHIYTLDRLRGSVISGNYCEKSGDLHGRGGIYLDEGSGYLTVKNNVVKMTEAKNWLYARKMTGNAKLVQIVVTDNFADTKTKTVDTSVVTERNTTVVTNGSWPAAAQAIIDNAGVEEGYRGLLSKVS